MRKALWPELTDPDNEKDSRTLLDDPHRFAVFVSESGKTLSGFVEASLRQFAEGCETSPVGCVEGWFVVPEARRRGVGRVLLAAAEHWAKSKGCTEMASQTLLDNPDGQKAHAQLGYVEVERQVCYRKPL
jgi:aminoglycoside 6'-N-acetyltransferase I